MPVRKVVNIFESIMSLIRNPQIYKFLIVGIGAALSLLLLTVFFTSILEVFYPISVAVAYELTLIWGFFAHDKWTFANIPKNTNAKIRFVKYNIFSTLSLGMNEVVVILLTQETHIYYSLSEFIAIVVTFFFNYFVHKKISWKN